MGLRGALRGVGGFKGSPKPEYPQIFFREPRHLIIFPSSRDLRKVDIKYPLIEPMAHSWIFWDEKKKSIVYNIVEPKLTKKEADLFAKIKKDMLEVLDVNLTEVKKMGSTFDYIENKLRGILEDEGITLTPETYLKVTYFIYRDFVGYNEIEGLLHDPYIEDIGCSGLGIPIYIVHRKFGSLETNIIFKDADYLNNFVIKLSERCGRYISYARPLLDGSLPDGSRVQATLAKDVTTKGPTFSIRKFRIEPFSPIELIKFNTASKELMAYIWTAVEARSSILICGGVSTGKTTFLNALAMFIPPEDKIVSIEDTRELNLPHENWIPAVSRAGFGVPDSTGKRYGEVTLFDLLRESFRQNPDYVVVGEVRGKEAYVMFQGMASGHSSIGTIHAGSVDDVIRRLETPPIELSPSLIETLDVVVVMTHAIEKGKSARRVKDVVEIESMDSKTGNAYTIRAFVWIPSNDSFGSNVEGSYLMKKISFEKGITFENLKESFENKIRVLDWMMKHGIVDHVDVGNIINLYYKEPKIIMEWVDNNMPPYKTKGKGAKKVIESSTGLKVLSE